MKYVLVGKIVGTHGIKGEVKVMSDSDFKDERFKIGQVLYLKDKEKVIPITIDSHRNHKGLDLITFNNLKNINDVLPYIQMEIYVDQDSLPELDIDEYYYDELIGLEAFSLSGEKFGKIIDVEEVPQGAMLVLKKNNGKEALIPFIAEFVREVNLESGIIIITPIEGLI
jgi:16S rRNA processing protein RimM